MKNSMALLLFTTGIISATPLDQSKKKLKVFFDMPNELNNQKENLCNIECAARKIQIKNGKIIGKNKSNCCINCTLDFYTFNKKEKKCYKESLKKELTSGNDNDSDETHKKHMMDFFIECLESN